MCTNLAIERGPHIVVDDYITHMTFLEGTGVGS